MRLLFSFRAIFPYLGAGVVCQHEVGKDGAVRGVVAAARDTVRFHDIVCPWLRQETRMLWPGKTQSEMEGEAVEEHKKKR